MVVKELKLLSPHLVYCRQSREVSIIASKGVFWGVLHGDVRGCLTLPWPENYLRLALR